MLQLEAQPPASTVGLVHQSLVNESTPASTSQATVTQAGEVELAGPLRSLGHPILVSPKSTSPFPPRSEAVEPQAPSSLPGSLFLPQNGEWDLTPDIPLPPLLPEISIFAITGEGSRQFPTDRSPPIGNMERFQIPGHPSDAELEEWVDACFI